MGFNIQRHKELTQVETRQDTALGCMRWGTDNSFPQTLTNLIAQSPSAKPAVSRTAKFYKGAGFAGENEVVSPYGLTLKKVVSILADDYAVFEAFAIQCNYNVDGKVVSLNPMRIAELRFNQFDELNFASKIGYHEDFGRNAVVQKTVANTVTRSKIRWIERYNPDVVLKQIDKLGKQEKPNGGKMEQKLAGIGKYGGQILYHSESGHSSYPIPPLQAPVNFVLADVENSVLVRKESSTGFVNTYLLKTAMDSEDATLIALEDSIDASQGARGTGSVITMSGLSPEEIQSTVLEEIGAGSGGRKGVIESAEVAYNLSQKVINGAYLIPPILAGADQKTGFSSADLKEAYFIFNSITQYGRDTIESELNRILSNSIFNTQSIEIKKLRLDEAETEETKDDTQIKEKPE